MDKTVDQNDINVESDNTEAPAHIKIDEDNKISDVPMIDDTLENLTPLEEILNKVLNN